MEKMTFDQKFTECKEKIFSVTYNSYKRSEINQYADVVELLAIFNKECTTGDIEDFLFGENDYDEEGVTKSEINDGNETFIKSIFSILKYRFSLFADSYPFEINNDIIKLKDHINNSEKNYIFLLISSSLDIFNQFQTILTTDFETVSYEALKKYLPNAVVKQFGKNSEYHGNAKSKIKQLACDLGLSIKKYEISQIDNRNNQERGLDIIGWIPFDDKCSNMVIFLCQCACGKDFGPKHHDTRRFENYLEFYKTKPQHTLFIPSSLINSKNKFDSSDDIEDDSLVFERKRIVSLIKNENVIDGLKSKELLEKCLADNTIRNLF